MFIHRRSPAEIRVWVWGPIHKLGIERAARLALAAGGGARGHRLQEAWQRAPNWSRAQLGVVAVGVILP